MRLGGAVLGLLVGWWAERRWVGFEAPADLPVQGAKIVIGLVGAFALRTVLKPLFAGLPGPILPDLLRYAIVLLWVIWWAPAIFVRLFGRPVTATPAPASPAAPPAPAG